MLQLITQTKAKLWGYLDLIDKPQVLKGIIAIWTIAI